MGKKVGKNFWISEELAEEFDRAVLQLAAALPHEKVEVGEVGAAAIQEFVLQDITRQLEILRNARVRPIEKVVAAIRKGQSPQLDNEVLALLDQYLRGRRLARRATRKASRPKAPRGTA